MVVVSKIKPAIATLTAFCVLLASLSQSVFGADTRRIEALLHQQRGPLNREYIKTPDGRQLAPPNEDSTHIRCRLWEKCMRFEGNISTHEWVCSFNDPGIAMDVVGNSKKKIVGVDGEPLNAWLESNGASSGSTVLILSEAEISTDQIIVDTTKAFSITEYHHSPVNRRLYTRTGVMNTLVVRVNANDNSPPSAASLSNDIFSDDYCLKSQFNTCSYGKLQIEEYVEGTIAELPTAAPGVVDLYVDANAEGNDSKTMESLANEALKTALGLSGSESPGDVFDLVLYCMPPGMGNWLSYAYIYEYDSYYNDEDCSYLSAQMHEVGHNLGLHHSGEFAGDEPATVADEYEDQTGYMGYTYLYDDIPAMCFNAAKNWELGWYEGQRTEVDILSEISDQASSYKLNGVVDYDPEAGETVVLKIGDFYIGYNKATDFNSGTQEAVNMVTIVENLWFPGLSDFSKLEAKLNVGDSHTFVIDDLDILAREGATEHELSSSVSITVSYVALENNDKDAIIEIQYGAETPICEGGVFNAVLEVELTTDNYPVETSWGIADKNGQYVYLADYGSLDQAATTTTTTVEGLCPGLEYYFVVADLYGDGNCCSWGDGHYKVSHQGTELLSGDGNFEFSRVVPFTIPADDVETPDIDCSDKSKEFAIELNGSTKNKDCDWLASKKKKKRKEYCADTVEFKGNNKKLHKICKETCGIVGKGECSFLKDA